MRSVYVIGDRGREHVIADLLARTGIKTYCAPGTGGMAEVAEIVDIQVADWQRHLDFVTRNNICLTVVGPEKPLSQGIANKFRNAGRLIVGPSFEAFEVTEGHKSNAKKFMRKNRIPTADFEIHTDAQLALERCREHFNHNPNSPIVIKADGLCSGKGVTVARTVQEAAAAIEDLMITEIYGSEGTTVVIEEFLDGKECSFHIFVNGLEFRPMAVSRDYKRRFDGDLGPNTGGMAAHSIDLSEMLYNQVIEEIVEPTLRGLFLAGRSYSGILYFGLMLTAEGPKLLEYNARLGEPEAEVVLPQLETPDLYEVLLATAEGRLGEIKLAWSQGHALTLGLVTEVYPEKGEGGHRISGIGDAVQTGVKVYHAGTKRQVIDEEEIYLTGGGRELFVTAKSRRSLQDARALAYEAAEMIHFQGKDYRRDIGQRAMK